MSISSIISIIEGTLVVITTIIGIIQWTLKLNPLLPLPILLPSLLLLSLMFQLLLLSDGVVEHCTDHLLAQVGQFLIRNTHFAILTTITIPTATQIFTIASLM